MRRNGGEATDAHTICCHVAAATKRADASLPNTEPVEKIPPGASSSVDAAGDTAQCMGGAADVFGAEFRVAEDSCQEVLDRLAGNFQVFPVPGLGDTGWSGIGSNGLRSGSTREIDLNESIDPSAGLG